MLIRTTFFTGLNQIELPATSKRGERFANYYQLTTDRVRIDDVIRPFAGGLGNVELSYLRRGGAKALVYRISDQEVDEADINTSLNQLLILDMKTVKALQFSLWVIKDNAACFDICWIAAVVLPTGLIVNNNMWGTRQSCANGAISAVHFDSEELRNARLLSHAQASRISSHPASTMLGGETLRYQRFGYFIDSARSASDVAMKIAQYCSGLEALVSTAQTELSHQVSERIAAILAVPGGKRIELFKQVKEAYGFRSKAVHGATFKPKSSLPRSNPHLF
jgi:hypothetical protein